MAVALRERHPVRGVEAIAERPDGSRVALLPYPTPLYDAAGRCIGGINVLIDITQRVEAEKRQALLAQEVDHRAKNILAVVSSLVLMTKAEDAAQYAAVLGGRIRALAKAHTLLATDHWQGAGILAVCEQETEPYAHRVTLQGPPGRLTAPAVQPVAMLLHELSTNAVKYGALAAPEGRIAISWEVVGETRQLRIVWREIGGPPAALPPRTGFGTRLMDTLVRRQLGGQMEQDWRPEGLRCTITVPGRFHRAEVAPVSAVQPFPVRGIRAAAPRQAALLRGLPAL
jgi:two-component sensor histidine kinase